MGGGEQMTKSLGANVPIVGESFEARRERFVKEVNLIGEKYKIALRSQLIYTTKGIVPDYVYVDVKEDPKTAKDVEAPGFKQANG